MGNEKKIEIPFGAKDSELYEVEYTIPQGYEAEIKDGKVIVRKVESEDERVLNELVKLINGCTHLDYEQRVAFLSWLDIHKAKVLYQQPCCIGEGNNGNLVYVDNIAQNPVEWNDKDKYMLAILFEMINYASDHYQHDDKVTDVKSWVLKSVHPQPNWKPSDEQMEALENAIKPYCKGYGWDETPLGVLYKELKKLKE